ncbi:hypothetical protein HIM_01460 [Hirsutella minnesotensis 3608]|nr:hypothetical protein HIM_01460 [Hirsutella minnesotensis 3608]
MAFQGAYGDAPAQQRPYAGLAAQPPGHRAFNDRPPPTRQYGNPGPYDAQRDAYGYDDRGGGGGYPPQNRGYGQPRDPYGPDPRGRGRPPPPDARRGDPYPPRGRGMGPGPAGQYHPNADQGRRPPMQNGHPPRREPPYGVDQDLASQVSGMSLNGPGQGGYGRPPVNGARRSPPRNYGYGDPRQGPPPRQGPNGYGGYSDPYMPGPNRGPVPPGRSMTMPNNDADGRYNLPPPQRADTVPYRGPPGRDVVPQRPSTASGNRPPPRRIYPPHDRPHDGYGMSVSAGGYGQEHAPSADDVFDSYFNDSHRRRSSLPDMDGLDAPGFGGSFEQSQRGAHQMPRLHHAKSEADFREPQAAVFEMASDIPAVPAVPQIQPYRPEYAENLGRPGGFDQMAPPPLRGAGPPAGPPNGPAPGSYATSDAGSRAGSNFSQNSNPDALPAHPTPASQPPQPQMPPPQQRQMMRAGHQMPPEPAMLEMPVTPQELEQLRMAIKANANDQDSAMRLAKKLMEAADVLAPKIPDPKQRARCRERYLMDAHKILKKLANAQNPDAMFAMADGLGRGLFGHEPDHKEAFTLYQSAAKVGHAAAAYRTAVCCEIGHEEGGGTRKDPLKAMQWYKRAATLGDPPAMYKLGMILLKGLLGQQKNPREAVGWLKRAAERADTENPHALHELGLLYESAQPNDVIIRDERYALTLFQQAADLGYKFSQFRLGCVFEYGLMGCPIDPRQSIFWYSKAAAQEEHQSELALSGWYLTGSEGVLGQSDTEAYLWARKAAVSGLAKAEYALGYFTEVGIGVGANLEDAKRWYWRAAAQEFPKARERLEDLKRAGKHGRPRPRERISRSRIERQQEGECSVM